MLLFLNEYNKFSDAGNSETTGRGLPKYYAMFGTTYTMTGNTDSTSGTIMFAPTPDKTYTFQVNFTKDHLVYQVVIQLII